MTRGALRRLGLPAPARNLAARLVRRGSTTVLLTGDWARLGNLLYYWLHADLRRREGSSYVVSANLDARRWLPQLPEIARRLSIDADRLGFFDRREWPPPPYYFQRFGVDFDADDLDRFVREYLLASPLLAACPPVTDAVVVNVRRGDFYSDVHQPNFGMDIASYLNQALTKAFDVGTSRAILVISDDISWSRGNLTEVLTRFTSNVRFSSAQPTPLRDFRQLAGARTLVLSNSTFAYWAGYVATVRFGEDAHVVAPAFHARHVDNGLAYQLHPTWDVIPVEGVG